MGSTLAAATSLEPSLRSQLEGSAGSKKAARLVGETIAERAKAQGLEQVVFDRGGYIYHGKVREVADGARDKGLRVLGRKLWLGTSSATATCSNRSSTSTA